MSAPLRAGNFGSVVAISVILAGDICGFSPARAHDLPVPPDVASSVAFEASFPEYSVRIMDRTELGGVPVLEIFRNRKLLFRFPLVSSLDSATDKEHLSAIDYRVERQMAGHPGPKYSIISTAKSSLWTRREFHWSLYADHIEYDQRASGDGNPGRCYFFSNGVSGRWDKGQSDGAAWNGLVMADRYWTPSPNHANQWEFSIAEPQLLGFGNDARKGSEEDFRPAQMIDLFSPPPLMLAFHRDGEWASVGVGTAPGKYLFPSLEYSGSRYAGAAWWVDYLGYQTVHIAPGGDFHSPVAAIHFAASALGALKNYSSWLHEKGFATQPQFPDVSWHHLPVFCGWAEQTSLAVPVGHAANAEATQKNYEAWLAELERRKLPVGTVVIDDKWQKGYGNFDVDTEKWPDLKGFVAAQHERGRHVLLWVPVAHADGLPDSLCVHDDKGACAAPLLGAPEYEKFLRERIRYLVETIGVDGFKEDWVWAPSAPGLPVPPEIVGIEAVRRFQQILYSEAHNWKRDAMVETQTANAAFRDSSDVLRLNDIWYATRDIVGTMTVRARIAHISGWDLVDTDNASSTTLATWWTYMQAQPFIGVPALYFVHRTETTLEEPSQSEWGALAKIWQEYIVQLHVKSAVHVRVRP